MDAETQAVFNAAQVAINWHYPESSKDPGFRGLHVALQAHAKAHPPELREKANEELPDSGTFAASAMRPPPPPPTELLRRLVSAAGKTAYFGVDGDGEQRLAHQELTEAVHAYLQAEGSPEVTTGVAPSVPSPQPTILKLEKGDVCVVSVGDHWIKFSKH